MVFNTSACPLDDLVLERRDPERSLPPIGLRYEHSARRPPGSPHSGPGHMKSLKVVLQLQPVILPRHPVRSRRGLGLKRPVDVNVVQERREARTKATSSAYDLRNSGIARGPGVLRLMLLAPPGMVRSLAVCHRW